MTSTFYISDTHFSHDNILKFEPVARPFTTIEEHDEVLIERWNAVVKADDTIIHLGDVCFKPATVLDRIMPRLNGQKKLILGNHDTLPVQRYSRWFEVIAIYQIKEKGMIFSHYPLHPSQLEFRYKTNVHGHCHSKSVTRPLNHPFGHCGSKPDPRYINISCEHTNLAPISQEDLIERIKP